MTKQVCIVSNVDQSVVEIYMDIRRDKSVDKQLKRIAAVHAETARHIVHLTHMSMTAAQFMDIKDGAVRRTCYASELRMIGLLAIRHDDGKIAPDEEDPTEDELYPALMKAVTYDDGDRVVMSKHPRRGFARLCNGDDVEKIIAVGCLTHHRFRRDPYPELTPDELAFCETQYARYPLLKRFCALIGAMDSIEALVADEPRGYLKGIGPFSWSVAIEMVSKDLNTDDPFVAEIIQIVSQYGSFLNKLSSF